MTDNITLAGLVATVPRHIVTNEGLTISSFRLASAQRRFDRAQERWIDVDTNWYTITAFRQLGENCSSSIKKGDRVVVSGRLKIREWQNGERTGTTVDIEAESIGHDLSWGTSVFSRTISSSRATQDAAMPAGSDGTPAESWAAATSNSVDNSGDVDAPIPDEAEELPVPF
ncbi:single-stranded DNA-binding protein [Salinibacterium sp. G-O1]|uniref:single-stranded DNA-binding protein n=1 Tax=Salinibacterium sp. G-O1 TaxID=3046208 RepID=UPI0024B8B873|nr:single-stranded DNA-binding protein [Salinibacterium sp. G-O1]MDJ0335560.1 single-stranded DNA-binding protein [Salinibacterium sp. G-O1]